MEMYFLKSKNSWHPNYTTIIIATASMLVLLYFEPKFSNHLGILKSD